MAVSDLFKITATIVVNLGSKLFTLMPSKVRSVPKSMVYYRNSRLYNVLLTRSPGGFSKTHSCPTASVPTFFQRIPNFIAYRQSWRHYGRRVIDRTSAMPLTRVLNTRATQWYLALYILGTSFLDGIYKIFMWNAWATATGSETKE